MAAGKHAHDDAVDDFLITYDDLGNLFPDTLELLLKGFYLLIDCRAH